MHLDTIRQKYINPPIIEALCEIHFSDAQTDPTIPGLFYEKIKKEYPHTQSIPRINFEMQFSQDGINTSQNQQDPMMRFFNNEKSELLQIANNLITVNRLTPYVDYESFIESIKKAVIAYNDVAIPKDIERISLRYINHIIIPETVVDLEKYFTYIPKIEEIYYKVQLTLELKPHFDNHSVFVKIASISGTIDYTKYLLDIYDSLKILNPFDIEFIEQKIGESHENIERVFETAITEKTRNLFEGE